MQSKSVKATCRTFGIMAANNGSAGKRFEDFCI
jgi:hypothetical protein